MNPATISAFLSNMKSYPVAAAIVIVVLFTVIARTTFWLAKRVINSAFASRNHKIQDKLIVIVRPPIWISILMLGLIVITRWLNPLPHYQFAVVGVLRTTILLVFIFSLNRLMNALFSLWRETRDDDDPVLNQIEGLGKTFTLIAGLAILLAIWQVDLAPLLASAGIISIVIAIAAQDALANFFGGISLFVDRPFKVGDYIVLESGERGEVIWIGMRSTRFRTRDDVQITVPNKMMASTKIINESAPNHRYRIRIKVGVAYGTDIDIVEDILLEVTKKNPKISSFPAPRVRFRKFGDSSLDVELLCWAIQPQDRGIVVHQLCKAIYENFSEKNITIPFPQREIHLHQLIAPELKRAGSVSRENNSESG